MGDIADMMMDGTLCGACGVYEDNMIGEVMRFCEDCIDAGSGLPGMKTTLRKRRKRGRNIRRKESNAS